MAGGRPELPENERRRNVRSVHLTDDELTAIEAAALRAGQPVTRWIRIKAVAAAKAAKRSR